MKRWIVTAICVLTLSTLIIGCSSIETDTLIQGNELAYVQEKLELGMGKAEVKEQFGRSFTSVDNMVEGSEVWRFDYVIDKAYTVSTKASEAGVRYDRSGFLSNKLSSQLFVYWTKDQLVKDAVVYFMSDGEIHEYRLSR